MISPTKTNNLLWKQYSIPRLACSCPDIQYSLNMLDYSNPLWIARLFSSFHFFISELIGSTTGVSPLYRPFTAKLAKLVSHFAVLKGIIQWVPTSILELFSLTGGVQTVCSNSWTFPYPWRVLFHLVLVTMGTAGMSPPEAILTELVIVTLLATVSKSHHALAMAVGTLNRVEDCKRETHWKTKQKKQSGTH